MRGIDILATNENFTYDAMYRVVTSGDGDVYVFNSVTNPLGVHPDAFAPNFRSAPKILEYKYSLDALIEDVQRDEKNTNDIDLVVVWETGEDYRQNYVVRSLLDTENLSDRRYHGLTHTMTNVTTGQYELDLIVLSELVAYLNDPTGAIMSQRQKYEE